MDVLGLGNLDAKHRELCDRLDGLTQALAAFPKSDQIHSRAEREWQRFTLSDGGVCTAGGALTIGGPGSNLVPAINGWEAFLTSVSVTVSGVSAAATVTNYNGAAADLNLFDYANAMLGNSPSRIVGFYDPETVYVEQDDPITIMIAGAAATATVIVRVCGKRRQT
jgi:hypothetical protein